MKVELVDDVAAFAASVTEWLQVREAENGLILGLLATMQRAPAAAPTLMVRVTGSDGVLFAALHGQHHLIVTRGPDQALDATVAKLHAAGTRLTGVLGPAREAEQFAQRWAAGGGGRPVLAIDQRIYELVRVVWPAPVTGRMRPVTPADLELVTAWAQAFDVESLPEEEWRTPDQAHHTMSARTCAGELFGWEAGGELVALAGLSRPTATTIAVNAVYTPPGHRRQGFATALVAAVSQEGLERGKRRCLLYTDLANPTSNAIYQRIGYLPVSDSRLYLFRPAP
jgi:predicted GNAT family acetyltransferase